MTSTTALDSSSCINEFNNKPNIKLISFAIDNEQNAYPLNGMNSKLCDAGLTQHCGAEAEDGQCVRFLDGKTVEKERNNENNHCPEAISNGPNAATCSTTSFAADDTVPPDMVQLPELSCSYSMSPTTCIRTPSVIAASLESGSVSSLPRSSPAPSSPCSSNARSSFVRLLPHQCSAQALLFVPEQRRVSTISGHSVRSCPTIGSPKELLGREDTASGGTVVEQLLNHKEDVEEDADEFQQLLINMPATSSRNASLRAQAASDLYCRVYGGVSSDCASVSMEEGGAMQQQRMLAVIQDRRRKASPPGATSSGSGN